MSQSTKKVVAFALLFALLASVLPGVQIAACAADEVLAETDYEVADLILDQVYAIAENHMDPVEDICAYLSQCPEVEESSVEINGNIIIWQLRNGIVCSYSPYLDHLETTKPDLVNTADTQTISYARRSTKHGSDVYLFEPYYGLSDDFTDFYQSLAKKLAAKSGSTYHYFKGDAANVENIADALETGGVVIFNSHGTTDYSGSGSDNTSGATTSYLCLQTGDGLTAEDYQNGHAVYGGIRDGLAYYQVDGSVLTSHMDQQGASGLVWMAICLGMATDGLSKPLMENGAGVVFGYSESVTFKGEACFATCFYNSLMDGNTVAQAAADMKTECGEWDYSPLLCQKAGLSTFYMASTKEDAQKSKAAFPVVVSQEDAYPGQSQVNDTQQVNSAWKLIDPFLVTALSADEKQGSVSVSGLTITATPSVGYTPVSCTVSPAGAAVLTQNGNSFRVSRLRQDCTVTVSFAEKEKGTLSFQTPEGVTAESIFSYVGDSVILPSPAGRPQSDVSSYEFAGWSEIPVEQPVKSTALYAAGDSFEMQETAQTLYAVYRYLGTETGTACAFTSADAEQSDKSGLYMITCKNTVVPGNTGTFPTDGESTMISARKLGMSVGQSTITKPVSAATFRISRVSGTDYYVIRVAGLSQTTYLAMNADEDTVSATANFGTEAARWRIKNENGTLVISSVKYPQRSLRCLRNGTARYLACLKSGGEVLSLYQAPSGTTTWYTSSCVTSRGINVAADARDNILPGQTGSVRLTIENNNTRNRAAAIYLTEYAADGTMIKVQLLATQSLSPGEQEGKELTVCLNSNTVRAKLIILDSTTNTPLCGAISLLEG